MTNPFFTLSSAGLQAKERFHHRPVSDEPHGRGVLEDGVREGGGRHSHALTARGR